MLKAKKIPVYEPGEDDYERHIATANLIYRFSTPRCVVQPKCACDNGGHSYAGGSTTNMGILMELGLMNEVIIDMKSETVTVKGGALWFHVYRALVSRHLDSYVANGGRCPTVRVSGFMLGGGLSPFTRSFGMGRDTVERFTIVTAVGDEVTVSKDDDPKSPKSRLFWALRGAGGGNFGVVVEMKLALKKLRSDYVVAGRYTWFPERQSMDAFITVMNGFYTRDWPNEMTIDSTWLCDLANTRTDVAVRFLVYYNGERGAFDRAIDDWALPNAPSQHAELKKQLKRRSLQEKSSRFLHETLAAQLPLFTPEERQTRRSGETRRFAGAVVFYHAYIMIQWDEKWLEMNMRGFLERMKPRLSPLGMVQGATFINFPDDSLSQDAHEISYFGNNHQELRRIKQTWDGDNFFKWSQGIRLPVARNATRAANTADQEGDDAVRSLFAAENFAVNEEKLTDVLAGDQGESYWPRIQHDSFGGVALPTGI
ncbi:hypothetical protein DL767_005591 [Monosporascus sp. MG133]|nr:hypothetical protein DL767_005591 [Monosporascus sp. MG133]